MPITRRQFELGIDSQVERWMREIHDYLSGHKDQAFTVEEIAEPLGAVGPAAPFPLLPPPIPFLPPPIGPAIVNPDFLRALGKLVELGAVEAREVRDKSYYTVGRRPLQL